MAGTGEHGQRAPEVAGDRFVRLRRQVLWGCSWQTLRVLCRFGWHGGQLHFEAGRGLAPTLDELPQHGKLRRRTVTVRSIQRPAQPRQCVEPIPASKAARTKRSRCNAVSSNKP